MVPLAYSSPVLYAAQSYEARRARFVQTIRSIAGTKPVACYLPHPSDSLTSIDPISGRVWSAEQQAGIATFLCAGTSETFDLSPFALTFTSNGAVASSTSNPHNQTRSLKGTANAGGASRFAIAQVLPGNLQAGGRAQAFFFFDKYPDSWSSSGGAGGVTNNDHFLEIAAGTTSGTGAASFGVSIDTTGLLHIYDKNGAAQAVGTNPLALNTAYRVSLAWTAASASVNEIRVFLNGALEVTASNLTINVTGGIGRVWYGPGSWDSTTNASNWYTTDIYIDGSSSLTDTGDIRVTAKRPNANGTTNGFTTQIGAGGSGYGSGHSPQVNERALSQTNGWSMVGAGANVTEEYAIEGLATGDVDLTGQYIVDYMGWVYAKALAGETAQIIVGGVATNITLTTSAAMYQKAANSTAYPAGATDIGIITATDLTTVSLYECGIVVAYSANPPRVAMNGQVTPRGQGYARAFNGTSNYLTTPDTNDLSRGDGSVDSAFTIFSVANVTDTAAARMFLTKYNTANREWASYVSAGDLLSGQIVDESAAVGPLIQSNAAITMGAWATFAYVYTAATGGATAASDMTLYQNASALAVTLTQQAAYVAMENLAAAGEVGSSTAHTASFFAGSVGLHLFIPGALTAAQVASLHNACRSYGLVP